MHAERAMSHPHTSSAYLRRADVRSSPRLQRPMLGLQRGLRNQTTLQLTALARRLVGGDALPPKLENSIEGARGAGKPLDSDVRRHMEGAFGADFSAVRVHDGDQADVLNRALSSRAFTTGTDIFFRRGDYDTAGSAGRELIAHELTHVLQQGGLQRKLVVGGADDPAEREADDLARQVVSGEPLTRQTSANEDEDWEQGP
jgi:hypothetical protein